MKLEIKAYTYNERMHWSIKQDEVTVRRMCGNGVSEAEAFNEASQFALGMLTDGATLTEQFKKVGPSMGLTIDVRKTKEPSGK